MLGRDHVESEADCYGVERIEYLKQTFEADGLPYIAEVAFGESSNEERTRTLLIGLNFSLIFTEPLRGFNALLAELHIEPADPVFMFVHIACPRFAFVDKGKTAVDLPALVGHGVAEMITKVAARWSRKKVAALRGRPMRRDPSERKMSIKDAAYEVMPEAYAHAAGDIGLANARQVMYAARPQILELTGLTGFGDNYFTQTLLPDYQREFPRVTEDWDVVYDDRGHFIEPHTGRMIGLGTLAVRVYFAKVEAPSVRAAEVISSRAVRGSTAAPSSLTLKGMTTSET